MKYLLRSLMIIVLMNPNSFSQWEQTSEINGVNIYIFTDERINIYAGSFLGVLKSTNDGNGWLNINNGQLDFLVSALIHYDGKIFAGRYRVGLFSTTNDRASWTQIINGSAGLRILSFARIGNNLLQD